jgi:hypothetical protein
VGWERRVARRWLAVVVQVRPPAAARPLSRGGTRPPDLPRPPSLARGGKIGGSHAQSRMKGVLILRIIPRGGVTVQRRASLCCTGTYYTDVGVLPRQHDDDVYYCYIYFYYSKPSLMMR